MPPALLMKRAIGPAMIGSFCWASAFLSLDTYVPLYVQGGRGGGVGRGGERRHAGHAHLGAQRHRRRAAGRALGLPQHRAARLRAGRPQLRRPAALRRCQRPAMGDHRRACPHRLRFGPASMAYLLAAQDAVAWQQRGIITSGIQFFRTIGGAIGIGLLGMLFNILIHPQIRTPAHHRRRSRHRCSRPPRHAGLSPQILSSVQQMIASGLLSVFVAMLAFACLQLLASHDGPRPRPRDRSPVPRRLKRLRPKGRWPCGKFDTSRRFARDIG